MRANIAIRGLLLGASLAVLSGCASYPVSKELRRQAKPLTLPQVASNPSNYTGTIVIWGGKVIQTVNDTNGGSLYVLQLPLDCYGTPEQPGVSTGRFIARSKDFIDPEVFRKGRLITVAGEVVGTETEPVQKIRFLYPVIGI
ncbi:MAG TPA: Slp family lipoprotein, partial [Bacillota bacterium]|nr:Slp family lipoprotein [Bacillota bacterium]